MREEMVVDRMFAYHVTTLPSLSMDAFTYIENGMQRNTEFVRTVGATMFHGLRVMDRSGIVHRGKSRMV